MDYSATKCDSMHIVTVETGRKASRRDSELELLVLSQVFEEDERVFADVIRSW